MFDAMNRTEILNENQQIPHVLNKYFINYHVALLRTSRSHNQEVLNAENSH